VNRTFRGIIGLRVDHLVSSIETHKVDLDRPDLCYMGTSIVSGTATAIVRNTGMNTYFGSMAKELLKKRPQNAFQLGVRRISWLLFIIMACMVPPVLLIQGLVHKDWKEAFLFGLSVAVGLTPEMLPMIVNATLARGAILMAKKKCIVKKLDSIINMGGMIRDIKIDVKYSGHVLFCIIHSPYELEDFSLISNKSH
jgi:Mg2+-importing ATPase